MDEQLKKEIKEVMRELLNEIRQEQSSIVQPKDSLGRKKQPLKYDAQFLFVLNKKDLEEFKRACEDLSISCGKKISRGEYLRNKVEEFLKTPAVEIEEYKAKK